MKNKYIIIDTETTGFHPYDGDELLQVSIIDTDGNVLFDEYFKPQHRTEWKEAEQVNGISPEMVADRPAISEKISEINLWKKVTSTQSNQKLPFLLFIYSSDILK